MIEQGLPGPVPQYEIRDNSGSRSAWVDFCWPDLRTIGEFDGKIKYGRLLRPGQRIEDVVYAEKRREDWLRELGWLVVRWVWADLEAPALLAARLQRAFALVGR